MILHINDKLSTWALWVASGKRVVGLGYPSQVPYMRLTPSSTAQRSPSMDEDSWEMEQAVHKLDDKLRTTVFQFYLHAGTVESHAKALRICRDTLYNRLHMAHIRIMEILQDCD